VLLRAAKQKSRWQRLGQSLDLTPEGVARTEELMEREFEDPAKNH